MAGAMTGAARPLRNELSLVSVGGPRGVSPCRSESALCSSWGPSDSDSLLGSRPPRVWSAPLRHLTGVSPSPRREQLSGRPQPAALSPAEGLSSFDPTQYNFYDFGIQDFLVMRQHLILDTEEDPDRSSYGGDYNLGLSIDPRPYLSDSELSVGSMDLSVEQVDWERRLVEPAASEQASCSSRPQFSKSTSAPAMGDGAAAVSPLHRCASDSSLLRGTASPCTLASPLARVLHISESGAPSQDLAIGEDCGSGSGLSSTSGHSLRGAQQLAPAECSWDMPPVVTGSPPDRSRILCSAPDQRSCSSAQPCLTHALLLAGLAGCRSSRGQLVSTTDLAPAAPWRSVARAGGSPAGVRAGLCRPGLLSTPQQSVDSPGMAVEDVGSQSGIHTARTAADISHHYSEALPHPPAEPPSCSRAAVWSAAHSEQSGWLSQVMSEAASSSGRCADGSSSDSETEPGSRASFGSYASLARSEVSDLVAEVEDEPQLTALERKLVMKKHPLLRNDTNAHILAPPDFRIGRLSK